MITRENVTNADVTRAFGPEVLTCPDCGHGIDPHGIDPGGPCGVGDESANPCPCLMQPNGIVCLLIEARVREARADELEGFAEYVQRIHPAGLTARTTVIGDALELAARIRNA